MSLQNKEPLSAEELQTVLEQYKLYVEMADKISERRVSANTFFTTINTLLIAIATYFGSTDTYWLIFISVIGCAISFAWYFTLSSYRQLNAVKYEVINEIEKLLPLSGYSYEWEVIKAGKGKKKYRSLSHIEKIIPVIFSVAYVAMAIFQIILR